MEATTESTSYEFYGEGLKYQERFKSWWSEARQFEEPPSPHDFLVNFGLPVSMVEKFLGQVLRWRVLEIPSHGSVGYFAWHGWTRVGKKYPNPEGWNLVTHLLRDCEPDQYSKQQDVISLMDATSYRRPLENIEVCFGREFSTELLQTMVKKIPDEEFENFNFQDIFFEEGETTIDSKLLCGVADMLPKLKCCSLGGGWEKEAFMECLGGLLASKNLRRLEIFLPDCPDEEDLCATPKLPPREMDQTWQVPQLVIRGGGDQRTHLTTWEGAGMMFLNCIPQMACLRELSVECSGFLPIETVAPYVVRELLDEGTQLTHLLLMTGSMTEAPVLRILDALRQNTSLIHFHYKRNGGPAPQLYREKIQEILQESNTTLWTATFRHGRHWPRGADDRSFPSSPLPWAHTSKLDFYLSLNQKGRAIARDPETKLRDFVDLLCLEVASTNGTAEDDASIASSDSERESALSGMDLSQLNICYGLLRELPVLWNSPLVASEASACRKRKVGNEDVSTISKKCK